MLVWFAETTVVAGILALVALAVSRLKPISPSVKHALWLVVFIKFVTAARGVMAVGGRLAGASLATRRASTRPACRHGHRRGRAVAGGSHPGARPEFLSRPTIATIPQWSRRMKTRCRPTAPSRSQPRKSPTRNRDLVVPAAALPASVASAATYWPSSEAVLRWMAAFGGSPSRACSRSGQAIRIMRFRRRLRGRVAGARSSDRRGCSDRAAGWA